MIEKVIMLPQEIIKELILKSRKDPRKRILKIIRSADSIENIPAVMINAMQPGTYVTPHKHVGGNEILVIYQGKLDILLFDESGSLFKENFSRLSYKNKPLIIIPKNIYHSLLVREEDTLMVEFYGGEVYDYHTYKKFASWAPEEVIKGGNNWTKEKQEKMEFYLEKLIKQTDAI